jgi:hypothetical protein
MLASPNGILIATGRLGKSGPLEQGTQMAVLTTKQTISQTKTVPHVSPVPEIKAATTASVAPQGDSMSWGDLFAFFFWLGGAIILAAIILTDLIISLFR